MSTAEDTVHRDLEVLAKRQGLRIQELESELAALKSRFDDWLLSALDCNPIPDAPPAPSG